MSGVVLGEPDREDPTPETSEESTCGWGRLRGTCDPRRDGRKHPYSDGIFPL